MVRAWRVLAVLVLVAGLGACGSSGSDSGADGGGTVGEAPQDSGGDGPVADDGSDDDRQVVVTGSMTIVSADPLDTADEATDVVEAAGGRVDGRSQSVGDDTSPPSATLTVRVPADRLSDTLDRLSELGEVDDLSLERQDVTLQVTDLDARIEALQASVDRLEALIAQATTTADLLEAENALTERQAELDSLTAQRAYLAEQVDLSTLWISLVATESVPAPVPGGFWGGVTTGWGTLVTAFNTVVVLLGFLLPWLLLAAVVGGVALLVARVSRRRHAGLVPPGPPVQPGMSAPPGPPTPPGPPPNASPGGR